MIERAIEHSNNRNEKSYGKWDTVLFFTTSNEKEWDATVVSTLENYFYNELHKALEYKDFLNGNVEPNKGGRIKETEFMEKAEYIKSLTTGLGYDVFKDAEIKPENQITETRLCRFVTDLRQGTTKMPEIVTPKEVAEKLVDILPDNIFNPCTKFFDPACKSGAFLKAVLDKCVKSKYYPMNDARFNTEINRTLYIIENQLYGIALSTEAYNEIVHNMCITSKNIKMAPTYYMLRLKNQDSYFEDEDKVSRELKSTIRHMFNMGDDMKIDCIISNPPYQEASASVYQHFIDLSMDLSDRVCMITKNNWMKSDTLKNTRERMIKYGIEEIINYPEFDGVFSGVSVATSIFTLVHGHNEDSIYREIRKGKEVQMYKTNFEGLPFIPQDIREIHIIRKIKEHIKDDCFGKLVYPAEYFRINSNGSVGRGNFRYMLKQTEQKTSDTDVKVIYMDGSKNPYYRYIKAEDVPRAKEKVEMYKILSGGILSNDRNVIRNINIADRGTVCSKSWGILYMDKDLDKVKAVEKYIKTKFVRFMTKLLCSDGMNWISYYRFSLVPLQDFSNKSDIDWSLNVSDINKQLYEKYGLSKDEIEYIETSINNI